MKSPIFLLALALSTSMGTFFVVAQNGNPPRNGPDQAPRERGPAGADHGRGGPESPGEPGGPGGFRLLPRDGQQQLDLTFEQAEQVSDLEAKIRLKLRKILTVEQFRHLNQIRSRQRPEGPNGPANETSESRGQQSDHDHGDVAVGRENFRLEFLRFKVRSAMRDRSVQQRCGERP